MDWIERMKKGKIDLWDEKNGRTHIHIAHIYIPHVFIAEI